MKSIWVKDLEFVTEGCRCVHHPYDDVDVHIENLYGFLNVWFGGQGTLYETEETCNAGDWYELPKGKTVTKAEVEKLKEFITTERTKIFQAVYFEDESHIFIS